MPFCVHYSVPWKYSLPFLPCLPLPLPPLPCVLLLYHGICGPAGEWTWFAVRGRNDGRRRCLLGGHVQHCRCDGAGDRTAGVARADERDLSDNASQHHAVCWRRHLLLPYDPALPIFLLAAALNSACCCGIIFGRRCRLRYTRRWNKPFAITGTALCCAPPGTRAAAGLSPPPPASLWRAAMAKARRRVQRVWRGPFCGACACAAASAALRARTHGERVYI